MRRLASLALALPLMAQAPVTVNVKDVNLKRTWAGLRPGSPDELPILGPMAGVEGYLNACGHFRTGILTSAITGVMLDALVRNEPLPLDVTPENLDALGAFGAEGTIRVGHRTGKPEPIFPRIEEKPVEEAEMKKAAIEKEKPEPETK